MKAHYEKKRFLTFRFHAKITDSRIRIKGKIYKPKILFHIPIKKNSRTIFVCTTKALKFPPHISIFAQ